MENRDERQPLRLLWVFVFGFVFSLAVVAGFFLLFAAQAAGRWDYWAAEPRLNQDQLFGVARNAVTLAAALGVGITLFFSYRKQQTTEKSQMLAIQAQETANKAQELATKTLQLSLDKHDLERTSELRNRYARSAEQLGSEITAVQLAGIHSLASLADDWAALGNKEEQQVCISLLCSFMDGLNSQAETENSAIRETAARSVASRLSYNPEHPHKSWGSSDVSIRGSQFRLPIKDVQLNGGTFNFWNCQWSGWNGFEHLTIEGNSSLTITHDEADMYNPVRFSEGEFTGGLMFINLSERISARTIEFSNCSFEGSKIGIASSNRGTTEIVFSGCTFTSGIVSVSVSSGSVKFARCDFRSEEVVHVAGQLDPERDITFADCQFNDNAVHMHSNPLGAVTK